MTNSKDIFKLQPGATYAVKIVPKGAATGDPSTVNSFATTFTVPTTNPDGTTINAVNSTVIQQLIGGQIILGDPLVGSVPESGPYVFLSKDGIQVGSGDAITFFLSSGSGQSRLSGFNVQQTGLVVPTTFTASNVNLISNTANYSLTLKPSYTGSVSQGMYVSSSPSRIQSNTYVRSFRSASGAGGASVVVYLSSSVTSTGISNVTFRAQDASIKIGTSSANAITIQGPNAGGIFDVPAKIFTTLDGISTTASSGAGFYIDENGNFRVAGSTGAVTVDGSGNLSVSGSIVATAGNIGGLTLAADKLSASSPGSYVGVSGSGNYAFWAGSANPALAPFSVTNTGIVTASNLVITNSVTVGNLTGSWSGITPSSSMAIFAGATASTGAGARFWVTNTGSVFSTGGASFQGPIFSSGSLTGTSLAGTSTNSGSLVGGAIYVPSIGAAKFYVDSSGNMTASNAYLTGSIVSTSGSIGGWLINTGSLTSGTGASAVGLSTGNYAIYAGSAVPSNAPFSVTNTGNLYAQNANITGTISSTIGNIGGIYINSDSISAASSSIYTSQILSASPSVFLQFETNPPIDSSSNNYPTIIGGTGILYPTAGFNGTGRTLYSPTNAAYTQITNGNYAGASANVSVEFWISGSNTISYNGVVGKTANLLTNGGWGIQVGALNNDKYIYLRIDTDAAANQTGLSIPVFNDNKWHHVVYAIGSGTASAFLDGAFYPVGASGYLPFSLGASGISSTAALTIYNSISSGYKDQVAIYNRLLTPTEILNNYNAGLAARGFSIFNNGQVNINNANVSGNINATSGSIGGFSINGSTLYGGTSGSIVGLNPTSGSSVIFAGATSSAGTGATFWVSGNGNVYSTGGASFTGPIFSAASVISPIISGSIIASSGSIIGPAIFVPNTASPTFRVDSSGNMLASSASISGSITSTAGNIGGWAITSGNLTSGTSGSTVGLTTGYYAIYAGSATPATAPFSVTNTGNLTATNAIISGSISAASGTIGGFSIASSSLTATNISLTSNNGIALGTLASPAFTVNTLGQLTATNATITGAINANSGSINGILNISSSGKLIAGSLSNNFVTVSGAGITGASAGIPVFTLPTDGSPPTIGQFKIVQTGLQGLGQVNATGASTTLSSSIVLFPPTVASTLWAGMSLYGGGIVPNSVITTIAGASVYVSLSASATTNNFTASGIPNANMVVGTDLSNNITIRGQNAPGVPGAIFTTIAGNSTTNSTGNGFYLDNTGAMNVGGALIWNPSTSLLTVKGSGSFTGSVVASIGNIGGWNISSSSISSGSINLVSGAAPKIYIGSGLYSSSTTPFYVDSSGSLSIGNKLTWNGSRLLLGDQTGGAVGFQAPANPSASDIAIYAGASSLTGASAAPFRVTYDGKVYATGASISGQVIATSGQIGSNSQYWYIGNGFDNYGAIQNFPLSSSVVSVPVNAGYQDIYSDTYNQEPQSSIQIHSSGKIYIKNSNQKGVIFDVNNTNQTVWWGSGTETINDFDISQNNPTVPFFINASGTIYSRDLNSNTLETNNITTNNIISDSFQQNLNSVTGTFGVSSIISDGLGNVTYYINDNLSLKELGLLIGENLYIYNSGSTLYDITIAGTPIQLFNYYESGNTKYISIFNSNAVGTVETYTPQATCYGITDQLIVTPNVDGTFDISAKPNIQVSLDGSVPKGMQSTDIYLDLTKYGPYPSFNRFISTQAYYAVTGSAAGVPYSPISNLSSVYIDIPIDGVLKVTFDGIARNPTSGFNPQIIGYIVASIVPDVFTGSFSNNSSILYTAYDLSNTAILGTNSIIQSTALNNITTSIVSTTYGQPQIGINLIPTKNMNSSSTIFATTINNLNQGVVSNMAINSSNITGSIGYINSVTSGASVAVTTINVLSSSVLVLNYATNTDYNNVFPGMIIRDNAANFFMIKSISNSLNFLNSSVIYTPASTSFYSPSSGAAASVLNAISLTTTASSNTVTSASIYNTINMLGTASTQGFFSASTSFSGVSDLTHRSWWWAMLSASSTTPTGTNNTTGADVHAQEMYSFTNVPKNGKVTLNIDTWAGYFPGPAAGGVSSASIGYPVYTIEFYPYSQYNVQTYG